MLRSFMAELLPTWLRRRPVREPRSEAGSSLTALASLQQRIRSATDKPDDGTVKERQKVPPKKRNKKEEPENRGPPPRDTHDWPSNNPNGDGRRNASIPPTSSEAS